MVDGLVQKTEEAYSAAAIWVMRRPIASRKQMAVSLVNEVSFSSEIEYNIPRKQSMAT